MNMCAKAVLSATQAVLPTMTAQKSGSIHSLASVAGKIRSKTNLLYNAGKATVVSMTKSLALAPVSDGFRVNCVCPGFVETNMSTMASRDQGKLPGMTRRCSPARARRRCRWVEWQHRETWRTLSPSSRGPGQVT